MKVLITGAGGQLGKRIDETAERKRHHSHCFNKEYAEYHRSTGSQTCNETFPSGYCCQCGCLYVCGSMRNRNGKAYLVNGIGAYYTALEAKT